MVVIFFPTGFGLSDARPPPSNQPLLAVITEALSYLAVIGAGNLTDGGRDQDNGYLYPEVACMSLKSEGMIAEPNNPRTSYYFDYHHTNADSVTALKPDGLKASVAAFAVVTYYIANA